MQDVNVRDDVYFANLPDDELAPALLRKIDDYGNYLLTTGTLFLWRRAYVYYYKSMLTGAQLNRAGLQGEYTRINVNHYRNLLLHLKTMATSQRPAWEPRAINSDYKSQAQTILANCLLDYYLREKRIDMVLKTAVEYGLIAGEGFVHMPWEATSGKYYGEHPVTGAPVYEGDLRFANLHPIDVIRDFAKTNPDNHDWIMVREYQNKWVLMEKYPEFADQIRAVSTTVDTNTVKYQMRGWLYDFNSDDVPVYTFYHKPTAVTPNGQYAFFLNDELLLRRGPLPYRAIPVYRLAPEDVLGTTFGTSVAYDLLPIQEALDGLYSTVITNQSTFGVQNIAIPKGGSPSVNQLEGGLNLIEYEVKLGPPIPLNLTSTPPEIFNFLQELEHLAETLSGVNSVARGNPEESLKSGSALALVQSQAIQFASGLIMSTQSTAEAIGTGIIHQLQDFANVPRVAEIAGKSKRPLIKEYTGTDLNLISRVTVDMGNPLTRTTAGKVQLAQDLMSQGLIKTPQEYIQVATTGNLDPLIQTSQSSNLLIQAENEKLMNGEFVPVIATDEHLDHIREHSIVGSSPEARENPELMKNLSAHQQWHLSILMDPQYAPLLQALGQTPMQGMATQQQTQTQTAQAAGGNTAEVLDAQNPVTQEAAKVNQPNMPKNALTGEVA